MVKPLRIDKFSFFSVSLINGLFVFESSNSSNSSMNIIKYLDNNNFAIFNINGKKLFKFYSENLINNIKKGDILDFDSLSKTIYVFLTSLTNSNTILITERCNSNCIFCSQPPKIINDDYLYEKALLAILDFNTNSYIGISGGEPTYNKYLFLDFFYKLKIKQNKTPIHLLTNGKTFSDINFVKIFKKNLHSKDSILAIPLYSHNYKVHDFIVQSNNSFHKTINGIINLNEAGINIEIRIVVNKYNIKELQYIIDFINSTLKLINCISIMNIEPIGYAKTNYNDLYVKINEQNCYLVQAISKAEIYGYNVNLYNYPLCLLNETIKKYSVKSISDWKNYFPVECDNCIKKNICCGFFTSAQNNFIEKVEPYYEI